VCYHNTKNYLPNVEKHVKLCSERDTSIDRCREKFIFLGEGPGSGRLNPGPLGQGSKIPDRTIETHTPKDVHMFKIANRRTNGQTER
jgi:hypothetical protein